MQYRHLYYWNEYGKDSYKPLGYFTIAKAQGIDKENILMDTGTRLP